MPVRIKSMDVFFSDIPPIYSITEITHPGNYYPAPRDWYIALADVVNSTEAIEKGRYKQVNSIAAASITAVLNTVPDLDLPFVFGGDGATILIPPSAVTRARRALRGAQDMAAEYFDLTLRIGLMSVQDVRDAGYELNVARLWVSENFQQAILSGGGASYAESQLKATDRYHIPADVPAAANFEGFECRWENIPASHEEVISLIVRAADSQTYTEILGQLSRIYGDTRARYPIMQQDMTMTFSREELSVEARVRYQTSSLLRIVRIALNSLLGAVMMRFNIRGWAGYKDLFVTATDHEKFDDSLLMTISGRASQRVELTRYLDEQQAAGRLNYGLHTSDSVLVTCLIFDHFGRQVHFVDTEGGGYALAARHLKAASTAA